MSHTPWHVYGPWGSFEEGLESGADQPPDYMHTEYGVPHTYGREGLDIPHVLYDNGRFTWQPGIEGPRLVIDPLDIPEGFPVQYESNVVPFDPLRPREPMWLKSPAEPPEPTTIPSYRPTPVDPVQTVEVGEPAEASNRSEGPGGRAPGTGSGTTQIFVGRWF